MNMTGHAVLFGARIVIGGILHETHTFMKRRTALAEFAAQSPRFDADVL